MIFRDSGTSALGEGFMLSQAHESTAKDARKAIRLIDSTTIDLNKKQFSWAHFRTGKAGIKLHVVYDPSPSVR